MRHAMSLSTTMSQSDIQLPVLGDAALAMSRIDQRAPCFQLRLPGASKKHHTTYLFEHSQYPARISPMRS